MLRLQRFSLCACSHTRQITQASDTTVSSWRNRRRQGKQSHILWRFFTSVSPSFSLRIHSHQAAHVDWIWRFLHPPTCRLNRSIKTSWFHFPVLTSLEINLFENPWRLPSSFLWINSEQLVNQHRSFHRHSIDRNNLASNIWWESFEVWPSILEDYRFIAHECVAKAFDWIGRKELHKKGPVFVWKTVL